MTTDLDIEGQPLNTKRIKRLASVAILLISIFAVVVTAFHFLSPRYEPFTSFINEYAVGRYGVLMSLGFISLGIGSLFLAIALYYGISNGGRSIPGLICLGIWALCVFTAGIFNTDVQGGEQSVSAQMHDTASLPGFVVIIIGSFLMLRFRRDDNWQSFYQASILISILMALAFTDFMYQSYNGNIICWHCSKSICNYCIGLDNCYSKAIIEFITGFQSPGLFS